MANSVLAGDLPSSVESLVQKLESFKTDTLEDAKDKIRTKTREVIAVLENQKKEALRAEKLDDANAIQREIERLEASVAEESAKPRVYELVQHGVAGIKSY
ncbi:MAG: hypothetical protein R3F11_02260 [Verrucomicrobiales bacterium]